MSKVIKFIHLPWFEKGLFFEAIVITLLARIFNAFVPFHKFSSYLGVPHKETSFELAPEHEQLIQTVYIAMRRSTKYLPFKRKCIIEAIVVKKLLDKFDIKSTVYFGVTRNGERNLIAHAWLRCGSSIVTGKKGMEKFVPVEWFS